MLQLLLDLSFTPLPDGGTADTFKVRPRFYEHSINPWMKINHPGACGQTKGPLSVSGNVCAGVCLCMFIDVLVCVCLCLSESAYLCPWEVEGALKVRGPNSSTGERTACSDGAVNWTYGSNWGFICMCVHVYVPVCMCGISGCVKGGWGDEKKNLLTFRELLNRPSGDARRQAPQVEGNGWGLNYLE